MATEKVVINKLDYSPVFGGQSIRLTPLNPKAHDILVVRPKSKISFSKVEDWGKRGLVSHVEQYPLIIIERSEERASKHCQTFTTTSFLSTRGKITLIGGQIRFEPKNLLELILLARNEFGFEINIPTYHRLKNSLSRHLKTPKR